MTVRINDTIYTMYFLTYVKDRYAFATAFLNRNEQSKNDYHITDKDYLDSQVYIALAETEAIEAIAKRVFPNDSFIVEPECDGYAIWGLRKEYVDGMD